MSKTSSSHSTEMKLNGSSGSPGLAVGPACIYRRKRQEIRTGSVDDSDVSRHFELFQGARSVVEKELEVLKKKQTNADVREIIGAQIEIVNDPELDKRIRDCIEQENRTADYAIDKIFNDYLQMISNKPNSPIKERFIDISDIRDRLVEVVLDNSSMQRIRRDHILVAKELSPREVIKLADKKIKAVITERGGHTSHAAIIARSVGIPAILGVSRARELISDRETVAVDAEKGEVFVRPGPERQKLFREKERQRDQLEDSLADLYDCDSETKDGYPFTLMANIEFVEELEQVKKVKAEGIGLVRTESIYLERAHFRDIEKQEFFYGQILEKMAPHPVTIRLFDAGGDKVVKPSRRENNPFLGWRGIRMLLDERELLRSQLKALLRTAGKFPGRMCLLVPMVSQLGEAEAVREEVARIQQLLREEGDPVDEDVEIGMMVEVPSLAVQIEAFVSHTDFFSVGTNDLTQYLLAADRGNEQIADLYDQRHPAVWKIIAEVVESATAANVPVAVCGELASDPVSAACLLGLGINELSMTPRRIPRVKKLLIEKDRSELQQLAGQTLRCSTTEEVSELFDHWRG